MVTFAVPDTVKEKKLLSPRVGGLVKKSIRSVSRFQQVTSVLGGAAPAGNASAVERMTSALILFMVSSSESEVHQEFDFLLVRGLRVDAADHRHSPTLAAQAAGSARNPVCGVCSHRSARRAARLGDGSDIEVVVVPRGVLLVADLP